MLICIITLYEFFLRKFFTKIPQNFFGFACAELVTKALCLMKNCLELSKFLNLRQCFEEFLIIRHKATDSDR